MTSAVEKDCIGCGRKMRGGWYSRDGMGPYCFKCRPAPQAILDGTCDLSPELQDIIVDWLEGPDPEETKALRHGTFVWLQKQKEELISQDGFADEREIDRRHYIMVLLEIIQAAGYKRARILCPECMGRNMISTCRVCGGEGKVGTDKAIAWTKGER